MLLSNTMIMSQDTREQQKSESAAPAGDLPAGLGWVSTVGLPQPVGL
jgi:hypothetical protein